MALLRATTQTLSDSYGAAVVIPVGWENITARLDDSDRELIVEIEGVKQENGTGEWSLTSPGSSTSNAVSLRFKSDSGTPVVSVLWFQ